MNIYKMIFMDRNEISDECCKILKAKNSYFITDYETVEISFDDTVFDSLTNNEKGILSDGLGREVFKKLLSKEIDFILVV